jgi:hypothetical protein
MFVSRHRTNFAACLVVAVVVLAGCGSSSGSSSTASSKKTTAAARPSGAPTGGAQAGQLAEIQACLKAAGISVDLPTGRPSFSAGATPPSGSPPAGGGAGGGLGAVFNDPKAQAALKACGITLPTGQPSGP